MMFKREGLHIIDLRYKEEEGKTSALNPFKFEEQEMRRGS